MIVPGRGAEPTSSRSGRGLGPVDFEGFFFICSLLRTARHGREVNCQRPTLSFLRGAAGGGSSGAVNMVNNVRTSRM